MIRILVRLFVAAVFVCGVIFITEHFRAASARTVQSRDADSAADARVANSNDPQNKPFVAMRGPLADFASHEKPVESEEEVGRPYKPSAEDHVQDSPVGTSARVLHRTFPVGRLVHVAFDIPPHAVTPRFHGTFSSYAQGGASPSHDEDANVDLLLMNEQQYASFAAGHDPDVLLIADTSHYQDINFDLAPSRDQAVKYHLVFRNTPGGAAKKLVKADFTVDF